MKIRLFLLLITIAASLTAQQNLAMSNNQLQTTLTRLSTGLQINSGADNPSGLIAATDLGNDIADSQQAISNSQVASQMISTADSALSQISTLLTSMEGLINEAANTATMSPSGPRVTPTQLVAITRNISAKVNVAIAK